MSVCYFSLPSISSVSPWYWHFMTDHLKGTCAKCMKVVPLEEARHTGPFAKTLALLFTSKDLRIPCSSFYCPHFLMVPNGALCGLRKMQLKWLYLLRQRCCDVPASQKHNPKAASAQKWDLALPWHACQNESGGWHAGSQIRVKEYVCVCVCVLNKNPPGSLNCFPMPEELQSRSY